MQTDLIAERTGQAGAQQYTFSTVQLRYVYEIDPMDLPKVHDSNMVMNTIWHMFEPFVGHHEEFHVVLMNAQFRILGYYPMSIGGLTGTVVDIRMLLQAVILSNCSCITIAHNHPSGTLKPSEADKKITRQVKEACDIMNIRLLDHVIITPNKSYYSFAEAGLV
jgi:DNA repair protein RadC